MNPKDHWERIYRTRAPTEVSWYQPEARISLGLIRHWSPDRAAPIIDIGGGAGEGLSQLSRVHAGKIYFRIGQSASEDA